MEGENSAMSLSSLAPAEAARVRNIIIPPDGMSFVSINAGNSRIKWCFHDEDNWLPYLFWESTHLQQHQHNAEVKTAASSNLVEYLPDRLCRYIFGEEQLYSFEAAQLNLSRKAAATTTTATTDTSLLRIYIVSSSQDQTRILQDQWQKTCPCIVHVLQNSDFCYNKHVVPYYEGMGTDRVAALIGAQSEHGLPALVFDAGTALTYTALDAHGTIIGGGIGPGIQLTLDSLHTRTAGHLPRIIMNEQQQQQQQHGRHLFKTNTKDAMLSATLGQTLSWIHHIIGAWLHDVGEKQHQHNNISSTTDNTQSAATEFVSSLIRSEYKQQQKQNINRCVIFTGGDGKLLQSLLETQTMTTPKQVVSDVSEPLGKGVKSNNDSVYDNLIRANNSIMKACTTIDEPHLIPIGIAHTLFLRSRKSSINEYIFPKRAELQNNIVGAKVSKQQQNITSDDYDDKFLVGKVLALGDDVENISSTPITTTFMISFENGSNETVNLETLNDLLQTYNNSNKWSSNANDTQRRRKSYGKIKMGQKQQKKLAYGASYEDLNATASSNRKKDRKDPGTKMSAAKRQKTSNDSDGASVQHCIGQRVAKYFGNELYFGNVMCNFPDSEAECGFHFHVVYDDGDSEDLDMSEIVHGRKLYCKKQHKDKKNNPEETIINDDTSANDLVAEKEQDPVTKISAKIPKKQKKSNESDCASVQHFVGQRVAKYFGDELYFGNVMCALSDSEAEYGFYFHVMYDDGDSEDLDNSEFTESIKLYHKKQNKDKKNNPEEPINDDTSTNDLVNDHVALEDF